MTRGIFSSVADIDTYKQAEKVWVVELQRYHKYWYDLVVNPNEVADYFDTRKLIVDYLRGVKKQVEENLEKRFVYFICSRTKIRFNTGKKTTYNPITKKVKIHVLIGKEKIRKSITCKFYDIHENKFCRPKVDMSEKYITITDSSGDLTTTSIHDFLEDANVFLGIDSKVEYVGYTKNPHTRPTNGSHTGLSDVLYKIADENHDALIYFNVFKVSTRAISQNSMINFMIANAMTDEVDVEFEGSLLEKCFIFYFDSVSQSRNKEKELIELKKALHKISVENNINSIHISYEFEKTNEYGIFSSSKVSPKIGHIFTIRKTGEDVEITSGSEIFESVV
ncbi:hypothetical protein AAG584_21405 [Vreelandella titanicae]|uniref:hypothetical protein n=1 Tax=Halomonadaceae TaxID=28256 RepID=UPI000481D8C1|nr:MULTISPECIES: hypothetical protein [unclassified Halomonas]NAO97976.1 hypothetical protein [Halomonas sp. MG34]PKH61044.1 hypothetical protein CXF94_12095 [Halomonas sp. Choline-3u-9]